MVQTQKTYKCINGAFVEDPNGFIIGFEWTDSNGVLRRTLYISSIDDLINETTSAVCRYEMFDPETSEWVLRKTENSLATMSSYMYYNHPDKDIDPTKADGALELNIYEDDTNSPIYGDDINDPIYDVDQVTIIGYNQIIVGYNQKIKDNLVPEFQFYFNFQMTLFNGVMQAIQVRKFGATSFD